VHTQVCSEERSVFCRDVRPGRARVIKCLMEAMGKPNFGADCREELHARSEVVKNDYRFDSGIMDSCADEVSAFWLLF
jgi:Golgi apparatus protein 1